MYLLFDIGGTNLRVAISENGETIKASKTIPTPPEFDEGINNLKQIADELTEGKNVEAVSGGIALIFDKNRFPINTSNLSGWVNKPIKQTLEERFKAPVLIENDSAIVGLGEANMGAGKGKDIVGYLGLGTGLGGVRIVDRKIDKNSLGFEPGHQIIVVDGKECHCGGKGHLESYIGGWSLEKEFGVNAREINDPDVWDSVARYFAIGINNVTVHWSPDIIVLGGAMIQSISLDRVRLHLKENLTIFPNPPEIVGAKLGHESGLYGALHLLTSRSHPVSNYSA